MDQVKHIWLVLSGKGGVGKSSTTTQLALTLVEKGYKVGVLDIDLTGPSLPRMFGVEDKKVHQSSAGWVPVYTDSTQKLGLMSLGFLLSDRGNSVVWRGPKKTAMIRQFMNDVVWQDLDYLIIDTPPGTSDEHITIAEVLKDIKTDGAILVTTPQEVAAADVRKELNFCRKVNFKVLGVVENMSGYVCPHCSECTNIFSKGGGEALARQFDVPFLGKVPLDPRFIELIEKQNILEGYKTSDLAKVYEGIVDKILIE
ncbi:Cytosolic Fe-S cluster assembly factor CFD1 [Wickerhamiella sorbophila]|uniref:Cytosolic Fe-S cluster assembly factor CFD1 n=1 Tax=Wickerhamiella sorbophila TaxID=45607 RepID=A0A2T0FDC6_9ASCO|nr:Cytosolic Fe-S cluster assembly factor CFD1 [Wickerhamiella sorbophila]PRT52981.1 Cytosolic Fe-S cluster assembly factor CFD1 [Wickerhamiella sorbophila]